MLNLTEDLRNLQKDMRAIAVDYGLKFPEVIFELLDYRLINQCAAYDGFPRRYPHWRFGMEYMHMEKSYAYGLHRIYEMVINTDPCYAYLLVSNQRVDQKLVMLHVYGHADFFKNNMWFSFTDKKMLDEMANHATRVENYADKYGADKVETFINWCLSLENLIDPHSVGIVRSLNLDDEEELKEPEVGKIPAKGYMDSFINPPEYLEIERERKKKEREEKKKKFPKEPTKDILAFLMKYAPLEKWQKDVIGIIREESYYFVPQRQTKIMNEGWASFIHSKLMTEKALEPDELIDYAEHHSGTVAAQRGKLNPYRLGLALFRDIEDRWNRGAFGKEWEDCESLEEKRNWDKELGLGKEKVFEVRRIYNDIGFLDEFLTEDFVRKQGFFTIDYDPRSNLYVISSRDFKKIKKALLNQLTNFGQPLIELVNANYRNKGELHLKHVNCEKMLDIPWAKDTLEILFNIWKRPVWIETIVETANEKAKPIFYGYKETGPMEYLPQAEEKQKELQQGGPMKYWGF